MEHHKHPSPWFPSIGNKEELSQKRPSLTEIRCSKIFNKTRVIEIWRKPQTRQDIGPFGIRVISALRHRSGNWPFFNKIWKTRLSFGASAEAVSRKKSVKNPDGSKQPFLSNSIRNLKTSFDLNANWEKSGLGWQVDGRCTASRDRLLSNQELYNSAYSSGSEVKRPPGAWRGGISEAAPNTGPFKLRHHFYGDSEASSFAAWCFPTSAI